MISENTASPVDKSKNKNTTLSNTRIPKNK